MVSDNLETEDPDKSSNAATTEELQILEGEETDDLESPVYDPKQLPQGNKTAEEGLPDSDTLGTEYVERALTEGLPTEQDAYDSTIFNTEGNITVTEADGVVSVKYHLSEDPTSTEGEIATPLLVNTPEDVINKTLSGEMNYALSQASNGPEGLKVEFTYWKDDEEPATDEVIDAVRELDPATTRESYSGR